MTAANTNLKKFFLWIFTISAFLFASCGSSQSIEKITEAEARINQVEQAEATEYANPQFLEAQSKLAEAKQLVIEKRYAEASLKADKVLIDTELAEVITLSAKAQEELTEIQSSIQSLKDKIRRINQDLEEDGTENKNE
jgi:uncharacterized protein YcfL